MPHHAFYPNRPRGHPSRPGRRALVRTHVPASAFWASGGWASVAPAARPELRLERQGPGRHAVLSACSAWCWVDGWARCCSTNPGYYLADPLAKSASLERRNELSRRASGRSSPSLWLFSRKTGKTWLAITDFIAPLVPLGLGAGRIGNFINGELWGRDRPTCLGPWSFPRADGLPRHPSQTLRNRVEGLSCSSFCGSIRARPAPRARSPPCS